MSNLDHIEPFVVHHLPAPKSKANGTPAPVASTSHFDVNATLDAEVIARKKSLAMSGFHWRASLPSPFGTYGWFSFRFADQGMCVCKERSISRDDANIIKRFAATFSTLVSGTDTAAFIESTQRHLLLAGHGDESYYYPRLSLALITRGLADYASIIGPYIHISDDIPISLPISPIHVWALSEAAKIHLLCIATDNMWADTIDDAQNVLNLVAAEGDEINSLLCPHGSIYLNSYEEETSAFQNKTHPPTQF